MNSEVDSIKQKLLEARITGSDIRPILKRLSVHHGAGGDSDGSGAPRPPHMDITEASSLPTFHSHGDHELMPFDTAISSSKQSHSWMSPPDFEKQQQKRGILMPKNVIMSRSSLNDPKELCQSPSVIKPIEDAVKEVAKPIVIDLCVLSNHEEAVKRKPMIESTASPSSQPSRKQLRLDEMLQMKLAGNAISSIRGEDALKQVRKGDAISSPGGGANRCTASPDVLSGAAIVRSSAVDVSSPMSMPSLGESMTTGPRQDKEESLECVIEALIELAEVERKKAHENLMEEAFRLGRFCPQPQGHKVVDRWIDGWDFLNIERRRKHIEVAKEELDKERKMWNKRKAAQEKSKNGKSEEMSDYFVQIEVMDLRKHMLAREEKELQDEVEALVRERNLHIREQKRVSSEENSRFHHHPVLHHRYLLLNLLGKGGFSEVYKAFDLREKRFVACKIHQYNRDWSRERIDNYIKHASRELLIHKSLNHPRIVKVMDAFDVDDVAFCSVLEYVEGHDLEWHLKLHKVLPEREARLTLLQIVSALKYLNEQTPPIIHYDMKPANVLLKVGKHTGEVQITDFGLSKIMSSGGSDDVSSGIELTSQGAGTYWYLPPECFETCGPMPPRISSKVDVWSLGVIFYQCLFGKRPFGNDMSQAEVLQGNVILNAKFVTFPASPKVSEGAKDFIRLCLTYRKESRPDVLQIANHDYLKPKMDKK